VPIRQTAVRGKTYSVPCNEDCHVPDDFIDSVGLPGLVLPCEMPGGDVCASTKASQGTVVLQVPFGCWTHLKEKYPRIGKANANVEWAHRWRVTDPIGRKPEEFDRDFVEGYLRPWWRNAIEALRTAYIAGDSTKVLGRRFRCTLACIKSIITNFRERGTVKGPNDETRAGHNTSAS
jgi:hypothetical protein